MSRCKCCDSILTDMEMLSKIKLEDGTELYDDLCFNCRSDTKGSEYLDRDYPFQDLDDGLLISKGFSDNY